MLIEYIAAGFDPARFWEITPRLYVLEMKGAARRAESARAMVWYGANMPRLREPPTFEDFVRPKARSRKQTDAEIGMNLRTLAAAWGAKKAG